LVVLQLSDKVREKEGTGMEAVKEGGVLASSGPESSETGEPVCFFFSFVVCTYLLSEVEHVLKSTGAKIFL